MKTFIAAATLIASTSVFAATVKITSFNYVNNVGQNSPLAELCGQVEGATAPSFIQLTVDHKSSKPAFYNTVAGANGRFCVAVITYRGTAEASLIGGEATDTASLR